MKCRVLGPLEVVDDNGRSLALGGHRQRSVLARLLIDPNVVVERRDLERAVWGSASPSRSALYSYVQRLNDVLAEGSGRVIVSERPGYRLEIDDAQIDSVCFTRLAVAGHAALDAEEYERASRKLGEALSLWQGRAFAGFRGEAFEREAARLEGLRINAVCGRAAADLRVGRAAGQIVTLRMEIQSRPDDESLRFLLLRVLQQCGRVAEALDVYDDAREQLFKLRGAEMPARWRTIRRQLTGEEDKRDHLSTTKDARPAREQLPDAARRHDRRDYPEPGMVGRDRELTQLRNALAHAINGQSLLALISGEPGIGKTYLVQRLAALAREESVPVLWGRCWEPGGAPPCWPWVEILHSFMVGAGRDQVLKVLGRRASVVAQLHERLAHRLGVAPAAAEVDARPQLLDTVAMLLAQVTAGRPLVILLEDLHQADPLTLSMCEAVAAGIRDSHLLIVGTYREGEVAVDERLRGAISVLGRIPGTLKLRLGPLGADDAGRLLTGVVTGDLPYQVVQEIHQRATGNPLLIDAWGRALEQARQELPSAAGTMSVLVDRLSPDRVETMLQPLARLGARGQEILGIAAVAGRGYSADLLAATNTSIAVPDVRDCLDEARRLGMIEELEGQAGRFRFRHDLLREAMVRRIPDRDRRRMHEVVGLAIEQAHALDIESHLDELAQHFGSSDDVDRALQYAIRASRNAIQQLAYENAVTYLTNVLPLARQPEQRCTVLLLLGAAYFRAGDAEASRKAYLAAAELARILGEPTLLAQAALGFGEAYDFGWFNSALVTLLREALAAVGDGTALKAALLARLAVALYWQRPTQEQPDPRVERDAIAAQAVAISRQLNSPAVLGATLNAARYATWSPDRLDERLQADAEIVQLARLAGDRELELQGHMWTMIDCLECGDISTVDTELHAYRRLANELNQPTYLFWTRLWGAMRALLVGDLNVVEPTVQQAWQIGQRAQDHNMLQNGCWAVLARLAMDQGRGMEFEPQFRLSIEQFPELPAWRAGLAAVLAWAGDIGRAQAEIDFFGRARLANLPRDGIWFTAMSLLADATYCLGRSDLAPLMYNLSAPYADRCVVYGFGAVCTGSFARHLGQLAALQQDWPAATSHFEQALSVNERLGAQPYVAHTLADWGFTLLRSGTSANTAQGRKLLSRAQTIARELGMTTVYEAVTKNLPE